jgi:carbon-monoxide dehydrogenase small subunit
MTAADGLDRLDVVEPPTTMLGSDDATLSYQLTVNGSTRDVVDAWLGESLLHVLRERLGLPGAKSACEQGECGSCSLLVDGALVCSCLVLGAAAAGRDICTVESLEGPSLPHGDQVTAVWDRAAGEDSGGDPTTALSDVQQAFYDEGAVQCGFCTPGLIMAVHDLLARHPEPSGPEVREAISGNLCRCTGYGRIFAAVERVVEVRRG